MSLVVILKVAPTIYEVMICHFLRSQPSDTRTDVRAEDGEIDVEFEIIYQMNRILILRKLTKTACCN